MRRLLMVILALALVVAACGDDDSAGAEALSEACELGETDGNLNLYNWTEYIPTGSVAEEAEVTDLLAVFEEEFGVDVVLTEYDSNETMLAQIEAGVGYDLIVPSDYMVSIMKDAGLLVKLNQDAIPNMSNIADEFTDLPYDSGNQYSAPYQWGTTGIGYKYGSIDDENGVSWGVIFDPAQADVNTGFISLLDDERETMGAALIYLGYSLNTLDEAEVDEAADLISATRVRLAAFNSSGYWDLLTSGETVVSQGWNGDFLFAYDEASTDDYDAYEDRDPVHGGTSVLGTHVHQLPPRPVLRGRVDQLQLLRQSKCGGGGVHLGRNPHVGCHLSATRGGGQARVLR